MQQHSKVKSLTLSAMMLAIIVILGLLPGIPLGFIPVPIVLQSLGIMLAAELLGVKEGSYAVGGFLLLVVLGLPFLSGGHGGAITFVRPTGGYLFGWLFTPLVLGTALKMLGAANKPWWFELIVVIIFGAIFIDIIGSIGLSLQTKMPIISALVSNLTFIPGDIIKAIVAVLITRRLRSIINR